MHALLTDPASVSSRGYRRFVQRVQLEGQFPDHLVGGEPYLACNALLLTERDVSMLAELSELFSHLFDRLARSLARDPAGLIHLGFPWVAAELLAAEVPRQPLLGRFDFLQDEDGHWWLLEFNADTPSGLREAIVADRLVHRAVGAGLDRPNEALAPTLVGAFCQALQGLPGGARLGLVTTASELEDLAQMSFTAALLRGPLGREGYEIVLGDADNLEGQRRRLRLCGKPVDALYRYVPLESMLGTAAFTAVFEAALSGRLRLLNGLYGLLLQHKGLLAMLWEQRDDPDLSPDQRRALSQHLPATWPIDRCPTDQPRSELVAKQVFGREGEEVFFGEDLSASAWKSLAVQQTYVAQRRLRPRALDAAVPTAAGPRSQRGHATVGSYVVAGQWAGFYTRFGGKVITSRAKWLATLIQPESLRS
jgi:glutathionylspermidine synthase